jgi:putative oxidoreductase
MSDLESLSQPESSSTMGDWTVRGVVAVFFLIFGLEKFSSDPHWRMMFAQIGAGTWFKPFTDAVEVLGALLVMIPRTVLAGLAMLWCTMAGAVLIVAFVLKKPADSIVPGIFLVALTIISWIQWRRRSENIREVEPTQ